MYEEILPSGEKLSEVINQNNVKPTCAFVILSFQKCVPILETFHIISQENVKYLPGIKLGKNVVADPDLEHAGNKIRRSSENFDLDYESFVYCVVDMRLLWLVVLIGEKLCSEGCNHVGVCDPTPIHGGYMQEACWEDKGRCGGYFPHQRNGGQNGRPMHDLHSHY